MPTKNRLKSRNIRDEAREEAANIQETDAALNPDPHIAHNPYIRVSRAEMEEVYRELWLLKGKSSVEADTIAVLSVENLDKNADPKKESTIKIEAFAKEVEKGTVTSFACVGLTPEGQPAIVSHLHEDTPAMMLLGSLSVLTHIVHRGLRD